MAETAKKSLKPVDWAIAAALGVLAAVVYFSGLADYAFPGESATLTSAWAGLESAPAAKYPLMAWFVRTFGCASVIAPVCGALSTFLLFCLATRFLRGRIGGEFSAEDSVGMSRLCGVTAAVVFLFTPAVREAATHLDPRIFDATWALATLAAILAGSKLPKSVAWIATVLVGVMAGFGAADTVVFLFLLPLFILGVWSATSARGGKGYGSAALFLFAFVTATIWTIVSTYGGFGPYADVQKDVIKVWFKTESAYVIPIFATFPFAIAVFSVRKAFSGERGRAQITFHALMTFVSVIAIATPFAASSVMGKTQYPPVVVSAFVAFTAGCILAYWWSLTRKAVMVNESVDGARDAVKGRRSLGLAAGGMYAVILALTLLIDFFSQFEADRGRFADQVAERIVADLDGRTWFVTDGTLDSHLRLAAKKAGKELNLICLQKDQDEKYIESLAALAEEKGLGGLCARLRKYGILTFLQDWFGSDPQIASKVAVFGAPDIWRYAPGVDPVPELLFFGGDPARAAASIDDRRHFAEILSAPEGWGSYRLHETKSDLDRRRLNLRRHLGFVACNAGCREQTEARKAQNVGLAEEAAKHDDRAFDLYELVLREIDSDNVSALFNEYELLERKNKKAESRRKEILSALESIRNDESRRYVLRALPLFYGYLMNPAIILKRGIGDVQGGHYEEGVSQIRRAMDLVPVDQRDWAELNILAPLYAGGRAKDRETARSIYTKELERDPKSRIALTGLARLAMMSGDNARAIELLEKATAEAGDDPAAYTDVATLRLMRGELDEAKSVLLKATDLEPDNLKALSLLAATVMRQLDALAEISDEAAREVRRKELEDELERRIIPRMEKIDPASPSVLSTKAFSKMRKGGDKNLKSARDDLMVVASANPENAGTGDMILGLDIQLNDREDAEQRATEALRYDAMAPLPNYVMGSIALAKGELDKAEVHLRRAVETERPVPMAINDLAELLRQKGSYQEAERFARQSISATPGLYVVWETLGTILLDGGRPEDLAEAERCIQKACDMSKDAKGVPQDPRMLISLARVQLKLGKMPEAKKNIRIVNSRKAELEPADLKNFQDLLNLAK